MNVSRKQAIKVGLGAVIAGAFGVKKTVDSKGQTLGGGGMTCNWVCLTTPTIGGNARKRCCYQGVCWWDKLGYVSWC